MACCLWTVARALSEPRRRRIRAGTIASFRLDGDVLATGILFLIIYLNRAAAFLIFIDVRD